MAGLQIAAGAFALPTNGARVTEAVVVEAVSGTGAPAYCRLRGTIAAVQATDPVINFRVNLPDTWNFKTVQYGGAGTNQTLVQATGAFVNSGNLVPVPLARGYATYGSDSGNRVTSGSFTANPQAWLNYSHESVKRTKDLVSFLIPEYYKTSARRNYHVGHSKGGQEGLQAVQRYSVDFDGSASYYPAAQQQALNIGWNRSWQFAFNTPGGALNTAKQSLLKNAVLGACDAGDGATDGIVSNPSFCQRTFNVNTLRCSDGTDQGDTCLSDTQLATLNAMATPFYFAYPMVNNVTSIGPWPAFLGGDLSTLFGNGSAPGGFYAQSSARPEAMNSSGIPYADWQTRVETFSAYDASNPNLDGLRAKGGKLLLTIGSHSIGARLPS